MTGYLYSRFHYFSLPHFSLHHLLHHHLFFIRNLYRLNFLTLKLDPNHSILGYFQNLHLALYHHSFLLSNPFSEIYHPFCFLNHLHCNLRHPPPLNPNYSLNQNPHRRKILNHPLLKPLTLNLPFRCLLLH